jgi:DNA-binding NarL/FixJ family response regulator
VFERNPHIETATDVAIGCVAGDEVTRRRMVQTLRRGDFDVIANTADIQSLIESCIDEPVQALVMALDLSELTPTGELRLLRVELPNTPIVVVSLTPGRNSVRKALAAGAHGYVREADIEDVLPLATQAVCAGQICVPQEQGGQVERPVFSFREKQVLELVARGFTNGEIARQLYLAESTVKSHLSSSFRKLGINSRKEAASIVLDPDNGLGLGLTAVSWAGGPETLTTAE